MGTTFRQSMSWLHTWTGVVVGMVLFAIFWMGTLSVFDREIDRWMIPATRIALPENALSLDALRLVADGLAPASLQWTAQLPAEREPVIRFAHRGASGTVQRRLDPRTAAVLPEPETLAGTRFIYPFHYVLHVRLWNIGFWLVGLAGMSMLAMCVSGVVIHRRIFADFFAFRTARKPRSVLRDLHTVSGVLGLPFNFVIALSGLIIFYSLHLPAVWQTAYHGDRQAFSKDAFGTYSRPKAGIRGEMASLDVMAAEASRIWGGGKPFFVRVWHPGDAKAYVEMRQSYADSVTMNLDVVYFDGVTGTMLQAHTARPIMTAQRFISGLHFVQFRHWTLRWLYFGFGLFGCVMITAGFLFWLESRRKRHELLGLPGVRIVEALTVGGTVGIVAATLAFFVVNRLLPAGATFLGGERAALEIWAFYLVWLAAFGHAWLVRGRAWIIQCGIVVLLAVVAVVLNAVTTGDHLIRSLAHRHLWAVAGMDLMLLTGALIAALAVSRLAHRRSRTPSSGTSAQPV